MPTKWIKAGSGGADPPERLRLLQVIVIKAMRPDRQLYALEVLYVHMHTYIHFFSVYTRTSRSVQSIL